MTQCIFLCTRAELIAVFGRMIEMKYRKLAFILNECFFFCVSGGRYAIYNVSGRSHASGRLGSGRVVDCGWCIAQGVSAGNVVRHAPSLHTLYTLCNDMYNFLEQDPKNVCIVHCMVGTQKNVLLTQLFCWNLFL